MSPEELLLPVKNRPYVNPALLLTQFILPDSLYLAA